MSSKMIDFKQLNRLLNRCKVKISFVILIMSIGLLASSVSAQAQEKQPYTVGSPLGLTSDGDFKPISSNVKVYGAIQSAESCIYDAERELIVVPSMGVRQNVQKTMRGFHWLTLTDLFIPQNGLAFRVPVIAVICLRLWFLMIHWEAK